MYSLEEEYDSHSVICWLNYDDQPTVVGKLRNVEDLFANAKQEEDPDEFIRKEPLTKTCLRTLFLKSSKAKKAAGSK